MLFLVWQDTRVLDYKSESFERNAFGDHNVGSNVRCSKDVRDNSHERIEICQFVIPKNTPIHRQETFKIAKAYFLTFHSTLVGTISQRSNEIETIQNIYYEFCLVKNVIVNTIFSFYYSESISQSTSLPYNIKNLK